MKIFRSFLTASLLIFIVTYFLSACGGGKKSTGEYKQLKKSFERPDNSARPGVYWYFMDGNLSREEMTADLESMKKVGIGHVLFLEVNVGVPQGPVKFLSEEWQDCFAHAVRECERLGIVLTLGSGPGWTGSGGPWVKMEESMQHLVASRMDLSGPQQLNRKLDIPDGRNPFFGLGQFPPSMKRQWEAYYQDVAVLAFPSTGNGDRLVDPDEKALYYRPPFSSQKGVKQYLPEPLHSAENFKGNPVAIPRGEVIDISEYLQEDGTLNWDVPKGEWTIMRFGRRNNGAITRPAPQPGLGFECDKMSAEAMKHHLETFMVPLIERIQPDPSKAGGWKMIHMDSWEMGAQNWTEGFREKFRDLKRYDPLPYLPVYTGVIVGSVEESERFLFDLRTVAQELILENHVQYFKDFGKKYGLGLSIEPYDMNPNTDLDLGSYADVPMCEFWNKGYGFSTGFSTFEGTSIANLYGRPVVAAEAFTSHLVAWRSYPGSIKNQNDWAFCSGINRLLYHTFAHKALGEQYRPGMTMGPYGVHWDRGQTWWEMSTAYHGYVARCQALLQKGKGVADVLYLISEGAPHVFLPPSSAVDGNQYLEGNQEYVFDAVTDQIRVGSSVSKEEFMPDRKGYNFDGCSPRILLERAQVKDGKIVFEGGASYHLLVLPKVRSMTPELLMKIEELVKQGATVIGTPVDRSPSLSGYPDCDKEVRTISERMWGGLDIPATESRIAYGEGELLWGGVYSENSGDELYPDYSSTSVYLENKDVKPDFMADGTVRYIHRQLNGLDLYFVSNRTPEKNAVTCSFRTGQAYPELWNPINGEIRVLPDYTETSGTVSIPLEFAPYESYFIVFRKTKPEAFPSDRQNFKRRTKILTLEGPWEVKFDPDWGGPDKVVFDHLEDWTERPEEGIRHYSGTANYHNTFDCEQAGKGPRLYLDLGEVHVMARVRLNGQDLGVVWADPMELEITDEVRKRDNQLEIQVVNLWPNCLIGDENMEESQTLDGKWPEWVLSKNQIPGGKYTFTSWKHYTDNSPLLPSGLKGPVNIHRK
ncbi:MAG: glycosyl hydrolase [Bacteroidales bacterium]|nr:glycosyl hydrolase [Bacteroidales bacterium]